MKLMYLFCFGLIALSCSEKPNEIPQETHPRLIIEKGIAKLDDSYASDPLDVENFKTVFSDFMLRKEPVPNTYEASQIDTIFHLSNGIDSLRIYKASTKLFLISMNIKSNRVKLSKGIFIGMSKSECYRKFEALDSIKNRPDEVLIWDLASGINFIFRADTLSQIAWEPGFD
jgi:hypothetical protein